MANPNVFQQYLQAPKSVLDYQAELDQRDALRTRNALQSLALQQQNDQVQQALTERNALRTIAAASGGSREALIQGMRNSGLPGLMTQANDQEQSLAKLTESQSIAAKNNAEASSKKQSDAIALHQQHLQALSTVQTPEDALNWLIQGAQSGAMSKEGIPIALQKLQQAASTPDGFADWKQRMSAAGLTIQQQMEMTAAKPTEVRLGNVVKTVDMNPRSATFGKEVVAPQQIGVSPDTVANNATSRANNAANIKKDLTIAGLDSDGSGAPNANIEQMAQAIAAGKAAPITGFALAKPQGQTVMRRVFEINPSYDETTYAAKVKAAKDFTTGSQGNAMRSFNVAGQHLDQLGTLVDALGNGNTQLFNKAANFYSEQTGNPAPTNFDAAKDVVSKEVVKAIVAGGGGVAERQELADLMSKAKSPAQLKGVITQYRNLMSAQHDALLQQRRSAGLTDDTLPNYGGGAAVPDDIAAIMAKHGGKPGAK